MDSLLTASLSPAVASAPAAKGADISDDTWRILRWTILALAAISRLWWLDGRPPHFDEGVNGWFTDQMRHLGCYQYDPNNYHGPLHFYLLFLFKNLLGRNLWALRLPTAFIGILTVDWCFRFEKMLGRRASVWTAVAMLVSPATLYFQRDAIHEAWLVFFLVLGFWAVCGLVQEGEKKFLWTAGLALTGMILTKETWLIHVGCLVISVCCIFIAETLQASRRPFLRPDEPLPLLGHGGTPEKSWVCVSEPALVPERLGSAFAPQRWNGLDLLAVGAVSLGLIVFFYSGNFLLFKPDNYGPGTHAHHFTWFQNIFTAYTPWGKKADEGEGHQKPFMYWCQLIVRNEPWTLFGLLVAAAYTVPGLPRDWRRTRGAAIALAAVLLGALVAANGWEHLAGATPAHPRTLRADAGVWWSLGGLIALAGIACVLLPPKEHGTLRSYGLAAAAGCIGALFLPWVYPEPVFFTVAFLGLAASIASLALPAPADWRVRWLAIYGIGTLLAYSIIRYKTPWCIISLLWPFFFTGGALLADTVWLAGRETAMAIGTAAAMLSAEFAGDLNFHRPTDDSLDLVYVQSFNDVWTVSNYLLDEAKADPTFYSANGVILCDSTYPLPWLLGDFQNIGYYTNDRHPDDPDGYRTDFLLVTEKRVDEVEAKLDADYYKQPIRLRPALEELQLYLRASRFKHQMPAGREPEFRPVPVAPAATNGDMGLIVTPAASPSPSAPATGTPRDDDDN